MIVHYIYTPVGEIGIVVEDDVICYLSKGHSAPVDAKEGENALTIEAHKQIDEYFCGKRKNFDLPIAPRGTMFMKKVWSALCEIPYGSTSSYKEVAEKVGSPKGVRAVGGANHRNPIPIIVPCHRVIGKNGSLVGFGWGLDVKKYLLDLEAGYYAREYRGNNEL